MDPISTGQLLIDQVHQRILDAIADGSLLPGMRVRQTALADSLGVSRQPVSHALHLLKRQGLLQESGRKGFEIAPIDPERIFHLYEARGALDALAARLCAEHATGEATGALGPIVAEGQDIAAASPSGSDMVRLDVAFHHALYHLSGNPVFEAMTHASWPHFSRSMAAVLAVPGYCQRAWAEHAIILARIVAGDPAGAEQTARDHALTAGRTTMSRLNEMAQAA